MADLAGKNLVILGLARQGIALARFAARARAKVTISDLRTLEQLEPVLKNLEGFDINFVFGEHPMSLLEGTDILAISGGVPADIPLVQAARDQGIIITNDSQEFILRSPAACIGITGSAGKTTTTALTGAMGSASGRQTWVGGNIGRPLISELDKIKPGDLVVQELSSFQLEIWQHSPAVAAVLNITPNHLDRHKTMDFYSSAKANILRFQNEDGIAVLSADDAGTMALAPLVRGRMRLFSINRQVNDGAYLFEDQIWLRKPNGITTPVCSLRDVQLRGRHNLLNICAAVTLADSVDVPLSAMVQAIRDFHGVEHRLELVATINGVQYVNDSIATAPERAMAAIDSFTEPIILLAGGKDKKMVWDEWARHVHEHISMVILFGDLTELLADKLAEHLPAEGRIAKIMPAVDLADAVNTAASAARSGDVVLLSPGGTSFDAYEDFTARGEHFRALVKAIKQKEIN